MKLIYGVLNLIDFRFWFCDCHYEYKWGLLIDVYCQKHGDKDFKENTLNYL